MRDYPTLIETDLRVLAEMNLSIGRERQRLDKIEADLQLDIATAKTEDGKPLFSNDLLRKAAHTTSLLDNSEYTVISQGLETLEKERLYLLAQVERRRLEFKLYRLDREEEIWRLKAAA